MNCSLKEYHSNWCGGVVRDEPTKEIIQEFSEQQGFSIEIAEKYFNKKCMCCDKKLKKDDIALAINAGTAFLEIETKDDTAWQILISEKLAECRNKIQARERKKANPFTNSMKYQTP